MKKIERCIKRLGKIRFPKGIDLEPLKRQARVNGNKGMSISDEFVADWFVVPSKGLAIYKTYDNLSLTNPIAKQIKNIRMYNELLCAKLCDTVGIKHAVYERAHYADTNGLISYSILDDQERLSSIISNTSFLGDFIEMLRNKEKMNEEQIRVIVKTLYSYMLFDIRTLQTDRNRNNVPMIRNTITGELTVGDMLDFEYAYLANNMLRFQSGGDTFFGVFDKKNGIDVNEIIRVYDNKMSYGGYYCLNAHKGLDDRSLDSRIKECCDLAFMSPELGEILDSFMSSFDLEKAIADLEKDNVKAPKEYLIYLRAIDGYVKGRFEYYRSISKETSKRFTGGEPKRAQSLSDKCEILAMLDMARMGSRSVSSSIISSYQEYKRDVDEIKASVGN